MLLCPDNDSEFPPIELDNSIIEEELGKKESAKSVRIRNLDSIAQKLDNSVILMFLVVLAGFCYLYNFFALQKSFNLNLNTINFAFMILGLLAHGSPARYAAAVNEGVKSVGCIILPQLNRSADSLFLSYL